MNQQTTRPQTATEILKLAGNTLGERGKQYDPAGKQERSMTAIVAAFNAIYPHNLLTVHMGWQFMSLVKMVRGATKPHADSALDQVAYAALAAEEVASALHQPAPTAQPAEEPMIGGQTDYERWQSAEAALRSTRTSRDVWKRDYGTVHKKLVAAEAALAKVAELERTNQELEDGLGKCQHLLGVQSQELKHLTDKLAAQQELLSVAQHKANFYFDKTNGCIAANESMTAKFQAERKANVAMHEEVTRLRNKVQVLADLAEYRDKRNAELCAELETQRGSHTALANASQEFKDELASRHFQFTECQAKLEERRLQVMNLEAQLASTRNSLHISEQAAETQRGKCIAQSSRISELQTLVDNLRSSLAQATKEAPCAHNTDEPKAPRPEYVDPFDQYGDMRSPMHRLVGSLDPARGGLAYPQGKDAPTPL
jgi:hypothetical protein